MNHNRAESEKQLPWLTRLADRMILCPSTDAIDTGELKHEFIPSVRGTLEAWTCTVEHEVKDRQILLIKFPGNGGRAERSTPNPAQLWRDTNTEIWTINPFGYGGSSGPASFQYFPEMVDTVFNTLRPKFPGHKIVVYGNSLGTVSALAMASKFQIDGLYLRNPVPIHQLIATRWRYALPSLGLSRMIAGQIPKTLDAVSNARNSNVPCLFVTSANDRLVPPHFQSKIIDSFAGTKRIFTIPNADHHESIPEESEPEYRTALQWLSNEIFS